MNVVRGLVAGTPAAPVLSASLINLGAGAGLSPAGGANIFEGTMNVAYYLTAPSLNDPTANLTKPWQAVNEVGGEFNVTGVNPLPSSTGTQTIPLLVTTPADTG